MLAAEVSAALLVGRRRPESASPLAPAHAANDDLEFSEPMESACTGAGATLCQRCGTFCTDTGRVWSAACAGRMQLERYSAHALLL